jgi:predicted RNA binding protein YcfA (HicA-like mRNA interferase family)
VPKLPVVSGKETIRALEKLGFQVARRRGSYIVLRKDDLGCVIPDHKELKAGTLFGILKQANVSVSAFIKAL